MTIDIGHSVICEEGGYSWGLKGITEEGRYIGGIGVLLHDSLAGAARESLGAIDLDIKASGHSLLAGEAFLTSKEWSSGRYRGYLLARRSQAWSSWMRRTGRG